jgi:glycogen operon protein
MLDAAAAKAALTERARDKAKLIALLRKERLLDTIDLSGPMTPALAAAVHGLIAATPALLALVQADDLAGEMLAVNLPGTVHERANWSRRLRGNIESLFDREIGAAVIAAVLAAGRATP